MTTTPTRGTYADRLAAALRDRYAGAVTVTADRHALIIERGNARTRATVSATDKRAAVTGDDIRRAVDSATARLASDIPHYRPEFVGPARTLVAILTADQITGTGMYGGGQCAYVLDGTDTDGTEWHRCLVHDDAVELSPDAPCAGA